MTLRLAHFALCAGILTSPAIGQEGAAPAPETGGAFIGRLFRSLTPHAPEAPTADFVRRSRPQGMNYVPFTPTVERTGADSAAARAARAKAIAAQLEAAAAANRARAARVGVPDAAAPKKSAR